MEDDLNCFENGRRPNFLKMEDDLKFLKVEDNPIFFEMEDYINVFLQKKDDINKLKNRRRP